MTGPRGKQRYRDRELQEPGNRLGRNLNQREALGKSEAQRTRGS
ncbi:hypothetical protein ABIB25_000932 [Nakamurella sp. UYEF19]